MHRDTQIGLAMAIVLIGLAAALCSPREPRQDLTALRLQGTADLDARINELPVRAYTSASHPDAPRPAANASLVIDPPTVPSAAESPPPEPIAAAGPPPDLPADTAPAPARPRPAPPAIVHVVQPGDTLSGIALQYLGSLARYPEIYEANRDVLASPDALRLGQRLRIPVSDTSQMRRASVDERRTE